MLQIRILLIARAIEINFVLYDANMLYKDVSRKPRLCAPFYRECPDRPLKHLLLVLILMFYDKRWFEDPIYVFAN